MKSKTTHSPYSATCNSVAHSGSRTAQLRPPKLLSWLALNAGISITTAEKLWHIACQDAAHHTAPGSSEFFGQAIDRLVSLIEIESMRRDMASLGLRAWARYQSKLLVAGTIYIDSCRQIYVHRMSLLTKRKGAHRAIAALSFLDTSTVSGLPRSHR